MADATEIMGGGVDKALILEANQVKTVHDFRQALNEASSRRFWQA